MQVKIEKKIPPFLLNYASLSDENSAHLGILSG